MLVGAVDQVTVDPSTSDAVIIDAHVLVPGRSLVCGHCATQQSVFADSGRMASASEGKVFYNGIFHSIALAWWASSHAGVRHRCNVLVVFYEALHVMRGMVEGGAGACRTCETKKQKYKPGTLIGGCA